MRADSKGRRVKGRSFYDHRDDDSQIPQCGDGNQAEGHKKQITYFDHNRGLVVVVPADDGAYCTLTLEYAKAGVTLRTPDA